MCLVVLARMYSVVSALVTKNWMLLTNIISPTKVTILFSTIKSSGTSVYSGVTHSGFCQVVFPMMSGMFFSKIFVAPLQSLII